MPPSAQKRPLEREGRNKEGKKAARKFATLFLTPSGVERERRGKGEANDPELIDFRRRRFKASEVPFGGK